MKPRFSRLQDLKKYITDNLSLPFDKLGFAILAEITYEGRKLTLETSFFRLASSVSALHKETNIPRTIQKKRKKE